MRYRRLRISFEQFATILGDGPHGPYVVIKDAIPADAKFVNVQHAWPNSVEVLMESSSFSELKEGEEIPFLIPIIRVGA